MRAVFLLLMLSVSLSVSQEPLVSIGNFFTSFVYSTPLPSCITPACRDELNVNFVIPKMCCEMLPVGEFISYQNETVDFLVPQFLSSALSLPVCRQSLLQMTENTFSFLQADQKMVVNVFENMNQKIPYCNATCLDLDVTQINLYITESCPNYCPQPLQVVM